MTKRDKDTIKQIETLGYEYDHTNSKGAQFYVHPDTGASVRLTLSMDERASRNVVKAARERLGLPTKDNKRNPSQIRERNAAEHARAKRELEAARASLNAVRSAKDEARLRDAEARFLQAEQQFRFWDRLMRENGSAA